jgi:hypothetical protein
MAQKPKARNEKRPGSGDSKQCLNIELTKDGLNLLKRGLIPEGPEE